MTEQTTWREATRASHHPNKHITHSKLTCQLFCSKRERESSVEWTEGDDRLGTQIEINTEMPFYDKVQTQREMKTISRDKHNKAEVIRFRSKRTVLWMKQTNSNNIEQMSFMSHIFLPRLFQCILWQDILHHARNHHFDKDVSHFTVKTMWTLLSCWHILSFMLQSTKL